MARIQKLLILLVIFIMGAVGATLLDKYSSSNKNILNNIDNEKKTTSSHKVTLCSYVDDLLIPDGEKYTVALFSDTHYGQKSLKQKNNLLKIIERSNNGEIYWDTALHLGDITYNGESKEFEAYMADIKELKQENNEFYTVAGNHDLNREDKNPLGYFEQYVNRPSFYVFDQENIHFIMISPSIPNQLSPKIYKLIKEDASANQDKIIILAIHYPYRYDWWLEINDLFEKYQIDIFVYGSSHCPATKDGYCPEGLDMDLDYPFTCYQRFNTTFINTGALFKNSNSFLIFTDDSNILQIDSYDHDKSEVFSKTVELNKKFKVNQ